MNDDQFDDLKQFIDSRVSQSETVLGKKMDKLEKKVDDGFAGVGEAIEEINQQVDERLTKLEQQST